MIKSLCFFLFLSVIILLIISIDNKNNYNLHKYNCEVHDSLNIRQSNVILFNLVNEIKKITNKSEKDSIGYVDYIFNYLNRNINKGSQEVLDCFMNMIKYSMICGKYKVFIPTKNKIRSVKI